MGLSRGHQGYLFVHLTDDAGANHIEPVGRLVMLAFVGPCPEGTRVRYGPGGKADCSLANLSYGRNPGNSTLTPEMVAAIKAELASPARPSLSSIARRHGVSVPCIWDISRGHSWGHIEPLPMTG